MSFFVTEMQFGTAVVLLLLAAKNINDGLLALFDVRIDYCIVVFAVSLVILPTTFFKSPQDFWSVARYLNNNIIITVTVTVTVEMTGPSLWSGWRARCSPSSSSASASTSTTRSVLSRGSSPSSAWSATWSR